MLFLLLYWNDKSTHQYQSISILIIRLQNHSFILMNRYYQEKFMITSFFQTYMMKNEYFMWYLKLCKYIDAFYLPECHCVFWSHWNNELYPIPLKSNIFSRCDLINSNLSLMHRLLLYYWQIIFLPCVLGIGLHGSRFRLSIEYSKYRNIFINEYP